MTDSTIALIERLNEAAGEATLRAWSVDVGKDKYKLASVLLSEAATELTTLLEKAEADAAEAFRIGVAHQKAAEAAEAAEARVKAVEASRDFYVKMCGERMEELDTAIRERDELRKALENARDAALEEAANAVDDMQCIGPCYAHYDNMSQTIRDLRRARASSDREGGE